MSDGTTSPATPPAWSPQVLEAGGWRITNLYDASFRLDGGAMWGVVPKNIWGRLTPAAEDNTIELSARPFLAERDGLKVVIEGGMGDRWNEKMRGIYHLSRPTETTLASTLTQLGHSMDSIDHVVCSHCHFDHVGALVEERDGELVPLFPNARVHFPAAELHAARTKDYPRRASYRADDIEPLIKAGLVDLHEGITALLPGMTLHQVEGHSEGMTVIVFDEGAGSVKAAFWGDLIPTTHHIQAPYIMAYDVDVTRSFKMRTEWLSRAAEEGIVGLSYHDPHRPFTRLVLEGRRYLAVDVPEVTQG